MSMATSSQPSRTSPYIDRIKNHRCRDVMAMQLGTQALQTAFGCVGFLFGGRSSLGIPLDRAGFETSCVFFERFLGLKCSYVFLKTSWGVEDLEKNIKNH